MFRLATYKLTRPVDRKLLPLRVAWGGGRLGGGGGALGGGGGCMSILRNHIVCFSIFVIILSILK